MLVFFFFKQKTAYEMRISDWSSDVCSSDLQEDIDGVEYAREQAEQVAGEIGGRQFIALPHQQRRPREREQHRDRLPPARQRAGEEDAPQIGRASCRERVCQYV